MFSFFIKTKDFVKQPEKLVVECQTMKMHQPPQHSCEKPFLNWCRFEFTTSIVNLSMSMVSILKTKHLMKHPKKVFHHIVAVECQHVKMHQLP